MLGLPPHPSIMTRQGHAAGGGAASRGSNRPDAGEVVDRGRVPGPMPRARAALQRPLQVGAGLLDQHRPVGADRRAASAAIAEDSVQPVPWVAVVATRGRRVNADAVGGGQDVDALLAAEVTALQQHRPRARARAGRRAWSGSSSGVGRRARSSSAAASGTFGVSRSVSGSSSVADRGHGVVVDEPVAAGRDHHGVADDRSARVARAARRRPRATTSARPSMPSFVACTVTSSSSVRSCSPRRTPPAPGAPR